MGGVCSTESSKVRVQQIAREGNLQDEARSYRSKLGAIRIILRNEESKKALLKYTEGKGKVEYVKYFQDLDELKARPTEEVRLHLKKYIQEPANTDEILNTMSSKKQHRFSGKQHVIDINNHDKNMVEAMCLGPIRQLHLDTDAHVQILKAINITQDLLLSQIAVEFEMFMNSKEYKESNKRSQLDNRRQKSDTNANKKTVPVQAKSSNGFFGIHMPS